MSAPDSVLPSTRRDLAAVAGLFLLPWLVFWRLWIPGPGRRYFPDGDFVDQFFAFTVHEVRALAAGQLPLWNPYAFSGSPFWADIQSAVAYPPSLVNSLAHALRDGQISFLALELEAVAHLGLAAVFTYLYARAAFDATTSLPGARGGAVLAALTFSLSGYLTGYPPLQLAILETVTWLPLILLGIEALARQGLARDTVANETVARDPLARENLPREIAARPPIPQPTGLGRSAFLGVVMIGIGTGMALLAGHPQSALLVGLVTAGYAVCRLGPSVNLVAFVGGGGLGVTLAAAGWWPALSFMRLSNRMAIDYEAAASGFPPRELLGVLVPGITHWSPLYVGALPLILAVGAGWLAWTAPGQGHPRKRLSADGLRLSADGLALFWLGVALFGLVLGLGGATPVYDLFRWLVPGFDLFRGQERAALLVAFGLAVAAGLGWHRFAERRRAEALLWPLVLVAGVGASAELVSPASGGLHAVMTASASGAVLAAWAGFPGLVRLRAVATPLALMLVIVDLAVGVADVNLVDQPPNEVTPGPIVGALSNFGDARTVNEHRLPPNFGILHRIESTSGASPLRLQAYDDLTEALADREQRLWELLAVGYVVTWRDSVPGGGAAAITAGEGDDVRRLFALDLPFPRAWRVTTAFAATSESEAIRRLAADDFDPLSEVILLAEESARHPVGSGGVSVVEQAPGVVGVSTVGDAPGWLVISEVYHPGWRGTLDGETVPVLRANVGLMAVQVPPGEHLVRLTFTDDRVATGLGISLLAVLVLLSLAALGWRSARGTRP